MTIRSKIIEELPLVLKRTLAKELKQSENQVELLDDAMRIITEQTQHIRQAVSAVWEGDRNEKPSGVVNVTDGG